MATTDSATRESVPGFGDVQFTVFTPNSSPTTDTRCALLADTDEARERGMMQRHDLGGYDAMVFRFGTDQTSPFWNRDVPIALSIAWFDSAGRIVSTADMNPCGDVESCPLYKAAAPYRYAVEVPAGGLAGLGIGPDAVLVLGASCLEGAPGR